MNRFLHRWLGIIAAFFILLFALSGIVLNHRSFFSPIDINRNYLPKANRYHNWNLSAVKSAVAVSNDSLLVYGNIGIWLSDSTLNTFTPFWEGIPGGADNRRTTRMVINQAGQVFAGTMSGLYTLRGNHWERVKLPTAEHRITGMVENEQGLFITTRSQLFNINTLDSNAREIKLHHPEGFIRETSLFRALWVMHSGKILGTPGKLFVDVMGIVMIFLSLTGIIWFLAPDMMRKFRKRVTFKKRLARVNKFSYKWHKHVGIWMVTFLLILTITGMFLRPPLLIPIVHKSFPALKHTILDHPNPWYDKLRDIQYDRRSGEFILSTSEGFYASGPSFSDSLKRYHFQPPISVMGINVFEQPADGIFITGSFSGIHQWNPSEGTIHDYITRMPVSPAMGMSHPFGSVPVAGYIHLPRRGELLFDYNAGVVSLTRGLTAPVMPDHVKSMSPIPLWNLALEVHTGRFYSFFMGKMYILFIPLMGLIILTILITGIIRWYKLQRRKKSC